MKRRGKERWGIRERDGKIKKKRKRIGEIRKLEKKKKRKKARG